MWEVSPESDVEDSSEGDNEGSPDIGCDGMRERAQGRGKEMDNMRFCCGKNEIQI